jgi:hypothetical protein
MAVSEVTDQLLSLAAASLSMTVGVPMQAVAGVLLPTRRPGMDEKVVDVARIVRSYLPELVGDKASVYDGQLRILLDRAIEGQDVEDELYSVLTRSPAVHAWVAQVLQNDEHLPPELQPVTELAYQALAGRGVPPDAQRYVCPVDGNWVWFRPFVGVQIPQCVDHSVVLVPG